MNYAPMIEPNRTGFKEWAVVCESLQTGLQSIILRKGGIHEEGGQFQPEHREFWLVPTFVHQKADDLNEVGRKLLEQSQRNLAHSLHTIGSYVVVHDVLELLDPSQFHRLDGLHIWNRQTLDNRFHFKREGLWCMIVRTYRLSTLVPMPDDERFEGCRSWVELPTALETSDLEPVLTDAEFDRQRRQILDAASRIEHV